MVRLLVLEVPQCESANSPAIGIAFDANAGKVVIVYSDNGNGDDGTAIVGTVSGTSISFGSASVYETSGTTENVVVYDANAQKVVIAYKDNATFYGAARVGTVSGTSISFGTEVVFESATITHLSGGYDSSAQKVVFSYQDGGNSDYGTSIVGTVSGTDISFGTAVVFESADSRVTSTTYDSNAQKVVVAYKDDANSGKVTVAEGTVSGTSISFATPVIVEEGNSNYVSSVYDSNASRTVIAYRDGGNSDYGTAVVFKAAGITLTAENYIGIAEYAAADTETATVLIKGGVSTTQSSLTPGQTYFVQRDGTIGTTAATPSVTAGTAVTSTKLIVKG